MFRINTEVVMRILQEKYPEGRFFSELVEVRFGIGGREVSMFTDRALLYQPELVVEAILCGVPAEVFDEVL